MMRKILIIGYGNTLRGDDGIGWRAVEEIRRNGVAAHVETMTVHQLDPELAAHIARFSFVVFVDASRHGAVGEVRCRAVGPDAADSELTHQMSPAALLAIARSVYGATVNGVEVTMCGERFDVGEQLSSSCASVLPAFAGIITAAAARV